MDRAQSTHFEIRSIHKILVKSLKGTENFLNKGCVLDSAGLGLKLVMEACEHGYETPCSMKGGSPSNI